MIIWHISDLHFFKDDSLKSKVGFSRKIVNDIYLGKAEAFLDAVKNYCDAGNSLPDILVVSGDLTEYANSKEFKYATEFIDSLATHLNLKPNKIIVVPGNHDIYWNGYNNDPDEDERLNRFILATNPYITPLNQGRTNYYIDEKEKVIIYPFNSCGLGGIPDPRIQEIKRYLYEDDKEIVNFLKSKDKEISLLSLLNKSILDGGLIGNLQLNQFRKDIDELKLHPEFKDYFKIAVLHHHLYSFVHPEIKYFETVVDSGRLKDCLYEYGFDVVLHGHKHYANLHYEEVKPMFGLNYFSAGSLFKGDKNNFNIIYLNRDIKSKKTADVKLIDFTNNGIPKIGETASRNIQLSTSRKTLLNLISKLESQNSLLEKIGLVQDYNQSPIKDMGTLGSKALNIATMSIRGFYLLIDEDSWIRFAASNSSENRKILRVLLLDFESDSSQIQEFINHRANGLGVTRETYIDQWKMAKERVSDYQNSKIYPNVNFEKIEVRLYDFIPSWRLEFIDENLFFSSFQRDPKTKTITGRKLAGIHVKDNSDNTIYDMFKNYYETIWDNSRTWVSSKI